MQLSCVWKNPLNPHVLEPQWLSIHQINGFFYGETAELFKSWIPVLYPQISCKIRAWANGVKLADHAFRWKDTFKKHSCCVFISGITYTLYICNQSIFPGECVEPFKFRLWQIWKAVGVLILTSRIFCIPPYKKEKDVKDEMKYCIANWTTVVA